MHVPLSGLIFPPVNMEHPPSVIRFHRGTMTSSIYFGCLRFHMFHDLDVPISPDFPSSLGCSSLFHHFPSYHHVLTILSIFLTIWSTIFRHFPAFSTRFFTFLDLFPRCGPTGMSHLQLRQLHGPRQRWRGAFGGQRGGAHVLRAPVDHLRPAEICQLPEIHLISMAGLSNWLWFDGYQWISIDIKWYQ